MPFRKKVNFISKNNAGGGLQMAKPLGRREWCAWTFGPAPGSITSSEGFLISIKKMFAWLSTGLDHQVSPRLFF